VEECFSDSNRFDTRGLPTGSFSDELEVDEFVDAVVEFSVHAKISDLALVTVQSKVWAFFDEACERHGVPLLPEIVNDEGFCQPRPRLCMAHPELVPIGEFGCFIVAGAFLPDVFAESENAKKMAAVGSVTPFTLATPSREWRRPSIELSGRLHSARFGVSKRYITKNFAITVDGVEAKLHATKRQNRYKVEVPFSVKTSGFQPCCSAKLEDGTLVLTTRMLKSVTVAISEPSSPTTRVLLERRPSVQPLSPGLAASMERTFRTIAKDARRGLTQEEFLRWFDHAKAAPRRFSLANIVHADGEGVQALTTLFQSYATAPGQVLALSLDLDGFLITARLPTSISSDEPRYLTFPNAIAATWLTFMVCQGDAVPSAERFFDLSFGSQSVVTTLPVTLPPVSNLVVTPFTRVVHQRQASRAGAIESHEKNRIRFDYAHPQPLSNDHTDETPLSLAEKHGTISTSKDVLRSTVRVVSESLKSEYFAQQMVRLM
jgi:hypothetical protein